MYKILCVTSQPTTSEINMYIHTYIYIYMSIFRKKIYTLIYIYVELQEMKWGRKPILQQDKRHKALNTSLAVKIGLTLVLLAAKP